LWLKRNDAFFELKFVTFAGDCASIPQVSLASEGGSGTAVPDLSIEVDNFNEAWRPFAGSALR